MSRQASVSRKTTETTIQVDIDLDSLTTQTINVSTGIGFLDHVGFTEINKTRANGIPRCIQLWQSTAGCL